MFFLPIATRVLFCSNSNSCKDENQLLELKELKMESVQLNAIIRLLFNLFRILFPFSVDDLYSVFENVAMRYKVRKVPYAIYEQRWSRSTANPRSLSSLITCYN